MNAGPLILLFPLLVLLETIAFVRFVPAYYRTGLPLLRRRVANRPAPATLPPPGVLKSACKRRGQVDILFQRIDEETVAFRTTLLQMEIPRIPPLGGTIRVDSVTDTIVVRGFVSWTALVVPAVIIAAVLYATRAMPAALLVLAAVIVGLALQSWLALGQFRRVVAAVEIAADEVAGRGRRERRTPK